MTVGVLGAAIGVQWSLMASAALVVLTTGWLYERERIHAAR